jgi:imidazolonepropionase-like amidohydrolase
MRTRLSVGVATAGVVTLAVAALTLRPPPGPPPPAPGFELRGVTVLDPGRPARPGLTVRGGERITDVEPTAAGDGGAFAGRYVLPGLVDLHVHHPPRFAIGERELFALLFLAHGVTSVRDTGAIGSDLRGLRHRLRIGETAGPRLFVCGPPLDGEPMTWSGARVVGDAEAARAVVADQAAAGFDCVKLYNGLLIEALHAAAAAATARGLAVVGHGPDAVPFGELHHTEVQHLMGLADSQWDEVPDARVDGYVRHSVRARLSHLPTLVAFAHWADLDAPDLGEEAAARLLPRHYRELVWNPAHNPLVAGLAPSQGSGAAERLEFMRDIVGRLHAAGVPVLAGTDTLNPFVVPGAALLEELGQLEAAGLSREEVLASATRGAARALGRSDLGEIRVGAAADLLVLREDPTRDLAALASLEAVVVGGRLYPRETLDAAVRVQLDHWERPVVRTFWSAAARAVLAWIRVFEA